MDLQHTLLRCALAVAVATSWLGCGGPVDDGGLGSGTQELAPTCEAPQRCADGHCDDFTPTDEIVAARGLQPLDAPAVPMPPPPLGHRSVRLGSDVKGQYLRPVIPAFRTSPDGRVALLSAEIASHKLEVLRAAPVVQHHKDLAARLIGTSRVNLHARFESRMPAGTTASGAEFLCQPEAKMPFACGTSDRDDCYRLVLIHERERSDTSLQLFSIPIFVRVQNPKTVKAEIAEVRVDLDRIEASDPLPFGLMAELVSTADGRMIAGRILAGPGDGFGATLTYRLAGGREATNQFSLFYAYSDTPCDVRTWFGREAGVFTSLRPIPAAAFDPRLTPRYGLAARPLRDTLGRELGETDVLAGSYPWLDREGNNLFFSSTNPMPFSQDATQGRWPAKREGKPLQFVGTAPRGFSVVGSWTQGKVVLLDGLINNDDSGFGPEDTHQLGLYRSTTERLAVRVNGGGKDGTSELQLPDAKGNNHHIESLENRLGMHTGSLPVTPRDVVWQVTRGLMTDEIAFDDYMDPHVVLFAEMNAAVRVQPDDARNGSYLDGFGKRDGAFVHDPQDIVLQNAATSRVYAALGNGRLDGPGRIEPVALGGVRGRGLFLDAQTQLRFDVPAALEPQVAGKAYLVSAFVDARDALAGARHVLTLDDAVAPLVVTLRDGQVLSLTQGAEAPVRVDLGCAVGSWVGRWHHLGLLVEPSGAVTVLVDGNPVERRRLATPHPLRAGTLRFGRGSDGTAGVRGWYDEARVVVDGKAQLTASGSIELLCNYARGLSLGVHADSTLRARAERVPFARTRAAELGYRASQGLLWCATDFDRPFGVGRQAVPDAAHVTVLRDEILLEGTQPLRFDRARPDSRGRSFCASCHLTRAEDPGRTDGLAVQALTPGMVNVADDPRTQPMQPPSPGNDGAQALGVIPAQWVLGSDGARYPEQPQRGPVQVLRFLFRPK
ncbi:MAG: hypothetical protein K1X89_10535 [Myxococcaceae bacterium]|nr:hypothetical protein [Myxococcaceae bacterium]